LPAASGGSSRFNPNPNKQRRQGLPGTSAASGAPQREHFGGSGIFGSGNGFYSKTRLELQAGRFVSAVGEDG
jgi:hypothetical protein